MMNAKQKVGIVLLGVVTMLISLVRPVSAASNLTEDFDTLFLWVTVLSVVVLLIVIVFWVYVVSRYRESNEEAKREELPHDVSRKLESVWTAVATAIVLILVILSFPVIFESTDVAESEATTGDEIVYVEGTDNWQWVYHLENGTTIDPTITSEGVRITNITLTKDTSYTFKFFNKGSYMHSYFVKAFNIKQDVIPGHNESYTFTPTQVGDYLVQCAEYCGTGHSMMRGYINVVN